MKLYQIVIKDILRRKRRVLYAALGVVVGTMTVIGILTIVLAGKAKIYDQLEKYGPNLTVIPAISNLDMQLGDLSLGTLTVGENYIPENYLKDIRQIADGEIKKALRIQDNVNIATIAPKLYVNTEVNGISVMMVGVDPPEENKIKTWWHIREGEYLDSGNQALVGAVVAELLSLNVGDKVTFNGNDAMIVGILDESGSSDDFQIFIPLVTLQKAFGKEGLISSIDIRALCSACPVEVIADGINRNIPGVRAIAVKQVANAEMGMMERVNKLMLSLAGITLAVGLFGVVNTMMASVNERIKDIGIMRAVGASRNQVIKVFIYEAIIIGFVGGVFGYMVGTLLAFIAGPLLFEGTTIHFIPQYLPLSLAIATLIAVIATIYPALRAAKIKVADSFRAL